MGALKIKVGGQYIQVRRGPRGPSGALTGEVKVWPAAAVPSGYLLCDGNPVSRAVYSELFAAIGTTHGVGDGSTTFNLPDYRGRTLVGVGTGLTITSKDSVAEASRNAARSHAHAHTSSATSSSSTTVSIAGAYTGAWVDATNTDHNHAGSPMDHGTAANTATTGSGNRATGGAHGSTATAAQAPGQAHAHGFSDPTHGHAGSSASTTTTTTPTVNSNATPLGSSQAEHPFAAVNFIIKT